LVLLNPSPLCLQAQLRSAAAAAQSEPEFKELRVIFAAIVIIRVIA
jgi:hypothetical protein